MPIWAASGVTSGLLKVREMHVLLCGYRCWACVGLRVVAGYTLGIVLGWGVVGVWLGMFFDWAVRAALFYWRMVTGRWLWKYPRPEREKCINNRFASE